jgi:hypothetical protein
MRVIIRPNSRVSTIAYVTARLRAYAYAVESTRSINRAYARFTPTSTRVHTTRIRHAYAHAHTRVHAYTDSPRVLVRNARLLPNTPARQRVVAYTRSHVRTRASSYSRTYHARLPRVHARRTRTYARTYARTQHTNTRVRNTRTREHANTRTRKHASSYTRHRTRTSTTRTRVRQSRARAYARTRTRVDVGT